MSKHVNKTCLNYFVAHVLGKNRVTIFMNKYFTFR